MEQFKRVLIKKESGYVSSLLLGLFTFLLILILALFTYRRYMIQVNFDYIDDNLVTSALGAAVINQPEYGRSNQVIIHDSDEYIDGAEYTDAEKAILLSELNYGSDVIVTNSALDAQQKVNIQARGSYNDDTALARSINALSRCLTYNISGGGLNEHYGGSTAPLNTPSDPNLESVLTLGSDAFEGTMLGDFIVGDAKVTRLDIYSLYRATLARRHIYRSEFFDSSDGYASVRSDGTAYIEWKSMLPVEGTSEWYKSELGTATAVEYKLDSLENFDKVYKPVRYYAVLTNGTVQTQEDPFTGCQENENYGSQLAEYNKQLRKYEAAREAVDNGWLICYLNSMMTFQGPYVTSSTLVDQENYRCFYSEQYDFSPVGSIQNPLEVQAGQLAPVLGYHVFSYKRPGSDYGYGASASGEYHDLNVDSRADLDNNKNAITIQGGAMDGTVVDNSSIYVELTFDIRIFPRSIFTGTVDWGTKNCTIGRLVDIEADSWEAVNT